jgi:uncharacterized RDD family membrane protein YckC
MSGPAAREYAGPVSRALAYLLDVLTVVLAFTGLAAAAFMVTSVLGAEAHRLILALASAYLVVLPALLAVYCALFWALAGRTPGMALLGLRVVATRSRALTWPAVLARALVLAYFPIGAGWALVDRRHQAVHDKIARTAVIRVPAPRPARSTQVHRG